MLALNPNEIGQPFPFGDSLYIIQVIERTEPQLLPFDQAKPYIQEILTAQKHEEQLATLTETMFMQANVVVYESVLRSYFQTLPTPEAFGPQP